MRHGEGYETEEEVTAQFLSTDPSLALVGADMTAFIEAHPCACTEDSECEEHGL